METRQAPFIPDFVQEKRQELEALCREFGVVRLELFGSATSDAFNPETSDLDFLVRFADDADLGPWLSNVTNLEEHFASLFGRDVDVAFGTKFPNPYFRRNLNRSRVWLYAA